MRCNDFDAHIDEMLSGILHPDANEHMHRCERCTSYFRARAAVQNGLHLLASATPSGPSRATDRAVMASYRRLQHRRASASQSASVAAPARLLTFPNHSFAPAWFSPKLSRTWWTGAAAAAVVLAVMGSAVHLWIGVPPVNAPITATAHSVPIPEQSVSVISPQQHPVVAADSASPRVSQRTTLASSRSNVSRSNIFQSKASQSRASQPESSQSAALAAEARPARPAAAYAEASNYDSAPVTQQSANAASVMRLAGTGTSSNVAQSASSTWPGYSNLMYCDPVVCSGPMQVVHIKVPVGQVKPNLGQTVGNTFVNAEVVVGPDGVARAIRVAH